MRLLFVAIVPALFAVTAPAGATAEDALKNAQTFLRRHCVSCHGVDEQAGRIRLDQLSGMQTSDRHLWTMIHRQLSSGQMPPPEADQPDEAQKRRILLWIRQAQESTHGGGTRRLNRRELSAALQDLTGLPMDFAAGLPSDSLLDGFDTGAASLQDAADSTGQFLEVSRRAVESLRFLNADTGRRIEVDFRNSETADFSKYVDRNWKDRGIRTKSRRLRCIEGTGLFLQTQWTGDRGSSLLSLPAPADKRAALKLTMRVYARRTHPGMPVPMFWVKVGGKHIDYRPISETPLELTYVVRMEDSVVEDGVIKVMLRSFVEMPYAVDGFENDDRSRPENRIPGGVGVYRPKFDRKKLRTPDVQPVPAIVIESLSLDYDYQAIWPPAKWQSNVGSISDDDQSARALLALWINRAWRRPVAKEEQERFFQLYRELRAGGHLFDDARDVSICTDGRSIPLLCSHSP